MNPILEPLTFPDKVEKEEKLKCDSSCLICSHTFDEEHTDQQILAHLLINHKLVIADLKDIVDLRRYFLLAIIIFQAIF